MIWAPKLLIPIQGPLVYLLGLHQLALIFIEIASIVGGAERECTVRSLCFFVSTQGPLVYLLGLDHLALIRIDTA